MIKQYREKYVSLEEANKILEEINRITILVYGSYKRSCNASLSTHSYIEDCMAYLKITTSWYGDLKPCTYIFYKPTGEIKVEVNPFDVYKCLRKYYKEPNILENEDLSRDFYILKDKNTGKEKVKPSAAPVVGNNKKYDKTEQYIYEYDLNSAYSAALYSKIPNTEIYRRQDFVGENEIGFLFDDELNIVHEGSFADIVFPLMESPYRDFIDKWYLKKKNAKNEIEKAKAKQMLNTSIGYLQKKNPYIRAYVIHTCNERVNKLIDENTVMWNTDAIYSLVERPDLKLSTELGDWKLEYKGRIRINGNNYQFVDKEETHVRGLPKSWFGKDFNLLLDNLPKDRNIYKYDKEANKICLNLNVD